MRSEEIGDSLVFSAWWSTTFSFHVIATLRRPHKFVVHHVLLPRHLLNQHLKNQHPSLLWHLPLHLLPSHPFLDAELLGTCFQSWVMRIWFHKQTLEHRNSERGNKWIECTNRSGRGQKTLEKSIQGCKAWRVLLFSCKMGNASWHLGFS